MNGFPVEAVQKYELIKNVTIEHAKAKLEMILVNPPVLISRNYPIGKMPKRNYQTALIKKVN